MSLHTVLSLFFLLRTVSCLPTDDPKLKFYNIPAELLWHDEIDSPLPPRNPRNATATDVATTDVEQVVQVLDEAGKNITAAFETNKSRKEVYEIWKKTINEVNQTMTHNLKPNEFAYLTPQELATHCLGFEAEPGMTQQVNRFSYPRSILGGTRDPPVWTGPGEQPDYWEIINWDNLYSIPIKDQGYCGSCWAFIGAYCLEHWHMRNTGNSYVDSSEQQHITCPNGTNGCIGGDHRKVFKMNIVG